MRLWGDFAVDLATIAGLVLALAALVVSQIMEGSNLGALFNASALVLILGGTLGATIISSNPSDVKRLPQFIVAGFRNAAADPVASVDELVHLAETARREGLLALEPAIEKASNPLLKKGIMLVVDGTQPDALQQILQNQIDSMEARWKVGPQMLDAAGGYAPTMGIIGTVMGLVHVLSQLSEPSKLGPAIATAFLATFYGIFTANVFWLPLGAKLKLQNEKERLIANMTLEGILAIQSGLSPHLVREKLLSMLGELQGEQAARPAGEAGADKNAPDEEREAS